MLLRRDRRSAKSDTEAKERFWELAQSTTPYVAAAHRGIVYILPTTVGPKLFAHDDRAEFVVLERACAILRNAGRLDGKEMLVDVGAHIGTTSIAALTNHGFRRAVAIEPDPAHLPLLRANLALNGLDELVAVTGAAMSDSRRHEQPFVQGGRDRWMKGRLAAEDSPDAVAVDTVSLAGLADSGVIDTASTGLVWFDCGGCEERALRSASAFLEQRIPLVFTVTRKRTPSAAPLVGRLRDVYEHVVDLRSPTLREPVATWTPDLRPVDDLVALPEGKKVTDVLVF